MAIMTMHKNLKVALVNKPSVVLKALSECTPAKIQAIVQSGQASNIWNVGDMTAGINMSGFSLSGSYTVAAHIIHARIIGIDHNSTREGTNRVHFQLGTLPNGTNVRYAFSYMNSSYTCSGGWAASDMRNTTMNTIYNAMPSEWQAIISDTSKWSNNSGITNNTSDFTETSDKLFLLSEHEVFGSRSYSYNTHESDFQVKYDYYTSDSGRIRYYYNASDKLGTSAGWWWLRSPAYYDDGRERDYFCDVSSGGSASYDYADSGYGVAPGFTVA